MLLSPILTQLSTNERAKPGDGAPASKPWTDPILSGTTLQCSRLCVEAAIELVQLVHGSYEVQTTGVWWWDVLYASTAGTVLIIAKTCPSLWPSPGWSQMAQSWDDARKCSDGLRRSIRVASSRSSYFRPSRGSFLKSPPLPLATSHAEARNSYGVPPLQSDHLDSTANLGLAASQEFQCLGSLNVMDSFFNWEKTSFENMGSTAFF
ncbi:hypothetical protein TOPH_07297 [Tolypocladium ophioglossoides CBS 100239]|uniref:Uncharacterized protein n=1 Tax=Tolypocladium ophioglossoides (strain CBS 100239) TaxID=1163406 RepID=A0A0L0N1W9_TOLOC|nr:hypothetical protein TOPH_07297 [Tolypocladium ophioglossoides CBS 100239]